MEGDRIAGLRSQSGSLLSVYVRRPSPGGFAALLTDLVRPLRERASTADRAVQKSVRADSERVRDLAGRFESDSAPAYAVFASEMDGLFEIQPLGHPGPNVAMLGPRPYLRPLRAAPRDMRGGILVADRQRARTFVSRAGFVDEFDDPMETEAMSRNWGGFGGYEEHTVRARADETTSKLWREVGERLLSAHMDRRFDFLAIGCHETDAEEIARHLHPYLNRLQRVTFTASPREVSLPILRSRVAAIEGQMRIERQSALAGRVCDTGWSGGNAVLGLSAVLDAANNQAIDTLVVAGPFTREGAICDSCGYLDRTGTTCPVCEAPLFAVDDIVAAAMDATVTAGGEVSQIAVASPLDVEGVGALTRFPVGV